MGVSGSREYNNYSEFRAYMNAFRERIPMDMIISGGARGVDEMAYRYSIEYGITFVCHPPKPEEGYPQKFFRRNLRIVSQSEILLAFPKGKSTGTRHSISLAKKLGIKYYVVEIK